MIYSNQENQSSSKNINKREKKQKNLQNLKYIFKIIISLNELYIPHKLHYHMLLNKNVDILKISISSLS